MTRDERAASAINGWALCFRISICWPARRRRTLSCRCFIPAELAERTASPGRPEELELVGLGERMHHHPASFGLRSNLRGDCSVTPPHRRGRRTSWGILIVYASSKIYYVSSLIKSNSSP